MSNITSLAVDVNVTSDGKLVIAKESIKRLKDKVRQLTKRNRGKSLEEIVRQLNQQLLGAGILSIQSLPHNLVTWMVGYVESYDAIGLSRRKEVTP